MVIGVTKAYCTRVGGGLAGHLDAVEAGHDDIGEQELEGLLAHRFDHRVPAEPFDFDGEFYTVNGLDGQPKPVQRSKAPRMPQEGQLC